MKRLRQLLGLGVVILGVALNAKSPNNYPPFLLLVPVGVVIVFADAEVMMWVPLYELVGMTIGAIMMVAGIAVFLCGGLSSTTSKDLSPLILGLGLMLGGALLAVGSEGLKLRMWERQEKKGNLHRGQ